MKKIFIILPIALLSVILSGQTEVNLCTFHSYAVAENLMGNCSQIEDNCEENVLIISNATAFLLTEENALPVMLNPYILRIALLHWNPPK
jgi:trehalose-6-phosphate synthase